MREIMMPLVKGINKLVSPVTSAETNDGFTFIRNNSNK